MIVVPPIILHVLVEAPRSEDGEAHTFFVDAIINGPFMAVAAVRRVGRDAGANSTVYYSGKEYAARETVQEIANLTGCAVSMETRR